jgi:cold-inducible RNA-binding protein
MGSKLYVGNLSFQVTAEQLRTLFAQQGEVKEAVVLSDRDTGRSRGFGFVTMGSDADAQKAIQSLNGQDFEGRPLKVNEAQERQPRGAGGGGRSGGGGGGGGRDRY